MSGVAIGVGVVVTTGVGVAVRVGVDVGVAVAVPVGEGVAVALGMTIGVDPPQPPRRKSISSLWSVVEFSEIGGTGASPYAPLDGTMMVALGGNPLVKATR